MSTPIRSAVFCACVGALRLLEAPGVPRAGEVRRASGDELEHRVRDRFEEPAVVRDEDDPRRRATGARARATPGSRRRGGSSARREAAGRGRRRARARATRASARRRRTSSSGRSRSRVREAEAAHDRAGALAPVVAAGVLEPGLGLAVAAERRLVVVPVAHRLLEPAQLLLGRDQVAGAREDVLAERQTCARAAGAGRGARRVSPSGTRARRRGARFRRRGCGGASSSRRRSGPRARPGRVARP